MKKKIIVKIALVTCTGTGTHGMGATRWVSKFLLRIDLPQSLYYSFLRVNLTAKLDWLAPKKNLHLKLTTALTREPIELSGDS